MLSHKKLQVSTDKNTCDTYSCSHCGYCTSGKDALKNSKSCGLCHKRFNRTEHLKNHLKTHIRSSYQYDVSSNTLKSIDFFKKHVSCNYATHLKEHSQ